MSDFVVGKIQQLMDGKSDKRIADLERQLAEAKAEIEAMRTVVEAVFDWSKHNDRWRLIRALQDYESRKKP